MKRPEKLHLAQLPTTISRMKHLSQEVGRDVWLWRDDLTGFAESGNKIRKLEFLLADALASGSDHVITCGGSGSNHARATAVLARRLGINVTLVMRTNPDGRKPDEINGNLLLSKLSGAEIRWADWSDYQQQGAVYEPFLTREYERLKNEGAKPYVVPEGGSCALGCFGYIAGMEEFHQQWQSGPTGNVRPAAIFCAVGSGGTLAGLQIGAAAHDMGHLIHGVNVCDDAEFFRNKVGQLIDQTREEYGTPGWSPSEINIHDGFVGEGYARATTEDLRFYQKIMAQDGVLLDPVYTGKAFRGMLSVLPDLPKGEPVVFLHSGGQFATFAFARQYCDSGVLGDL